MLLVDWSTFKVFKDFKRCGFQCVCLLKNGQIIWTIASDRRCQLCFLFGKKCVVYCLAINSEQTMYIPTTSLGLVSGTLVGNLVRPCLQRASILEGSLHKLLTWCNKVLDVLERLGMFWI